MSPSGSLSSSMSPVAYELVYEAVHVAKMSGFPTLGFLAGALTFFFADLLIGRMGGRQDADTNPAAHSSLVAPLVLGIILDGIPESVVIGLGVLQGGTVSIAMLVAVFISNLPEGRREHVGNESWRMEPREGISALGNDRIGLCFRIGRGLCASRRCLQLRAGRGPSICGRRDPHDVGEHDDPRSLRARRQACGTRHGRWIHDCGMARRPRACGGWLEIRAEPLHQRERGVKRP